MGWDPYGETPVCVCAPSPSPLSSLSLSLSLFVYVCVSLTVCLHVCVCVCVCVCKYMCLGGYVCVVVNRIHEYSAHALLPSLIYQL